MDVAEGVTVAGAGATVGVARVGVADRVGVAGVVDAGVAIGVMVFWATATANVPVAVGTLSDRGTPAQALMGLSAANQMRVNQAIRLPGNFALRTYALVERSSRTSMFNPSNCKSSIASGRGLLLGKSSIVVNYQIKWIATPFTLKALVSKLFVSALIIFDSHL